MYKRHFYIKQNLKADIPTAKVLKLFVIAVKY